MPPIEPPRGVKRRVQDQALKKQAQKSQENLQDGMNISAVLQIGLGKAFIDIGNALAVRRLARQHLRLGFGRLAIKPAQPLAGFARFGPIVRQKGQLGFRAHDRQTKPNLRPPRPER